MNYLVYSKAQLRLQAGNRFMVLPEPKRRATSLPLDLLSTFASLRILLPRNSNQRRIPFGLVYRDGVHGFCRIVGRRRDQCRIAALLPVGGARYTPVLSALRPRSHLALLAADAASQLNEA